MPAIKEKALCLESGDESIQQDGVSPHTRKGAEEKLNKEERQEGRKVNW